LDRETELEYQIFNGTKSASIILEDIRVGDIIEYSYSIKGINPVFQKSYYGRNTVQWSVPVQEYKLRLLHPQSRPINIKYHKTDLTPEVFRKNQQVEYRWISKNPPVISGERQLPAAYTLYPWIQFSEANTWQDIVQWALPLYQLDVKPGPKLQVIIEKISKSHPSQEQRVTAILQFVQEQIRYLGIEIGSGSYVPNPANLVLQRRFGDCKDKTMLMITMLKAFGIEAYPALVNTDLHNGISEWQPAATAFDHVMVYAKLNNKAYWLDPTRQPQKGNLDRIYQPDYGLALLVKADSISLSQMPPAKIYKKIIVDDWTFNETDSSATYKITTLYRGNSADYIRHKLASKPLKETQETYLNYFAKIYPSIVLTQPFNIIDDTEKNELQVEEVYSIPNIWEEGKDQQGKLGADFYPVDLFDYSKKPKILHRKQPLALEHPIYIEQKTRIHLGDGWDLEDTQVKLQNTGFYFEKNIKYTAGVLQLDYQYRSKSRAIKLGDFKQYLTDLETMDDELGYSLWKYGAEFNVESDTEETNWTLVILFILAGSIFLMLSIWVYRHDSNKPVLSEQETKSEHAGIRGWLLFPALAVIINPLQIMNSLYSDILPSLSLPIWNQLTQTGSEMYHSAWAPILILETLVNLGLLFFAFAIIILFFQKRRTLPKFYISFLALSLVFVLIDHLTLMNFKPVADQLTSADTRDTTRVVISSLIWISYFMISKRVKATFVEPKK
jgi:transglutaminase-like putative cysteine protease